MKPLLVAGLLGALACKNPPVIDRGGKSLDVPVPSSGRAATTKGPEKEIFAFPRRARQDPSRLGVKSGPYGAYLVDGEGRSLYSFSDDVSGQTGCFTNCATVWPPVIVKKLPSVANPAIDASKLGTTDRQDGSHQLTYGGLPLYYAESDLKSGDTWGHYAMSFGGHFALVAPDGKPLPPPK